MRHDPRDDASHVVVVVIGVHDNNNNKSHYLSAMMQTIIMNHYRSNFGSEKAADLATAGMPLIIV